MSWNSIAWYEWVLVSIPLFFLLVFMIFTDDGRTLLGAWAAWLILFFMLGSCIHIVNCIGYCH